MARLLAAPIRPGIVTWIGIRPERNEPVLPVSNAALDPAQGLVGDHYRTGRSTTRQITLIGQENLAAIASFLGLDQVDPSHLRRNIVVSGINLLALKACRFRLGSALLEATGECHPCSRMEEVFGAGGYNAVRGHGGITARIVEGGVVRIGDRVQRVDSQAPAAMVHSGRQ